jgi:hypothetical protein
MHFLFRRPQVVATLLRCTLLFFVVFGSGCAAFVENFRPVIYGKTAKEKLRKGHSLAQRREQSRRWQVL